MNQSAITLRLSSAEALVLFDMLARVDSEKSVLFADPAEQKVLWTLEGQLEKALTEPLRPNYQNLVVEARRAVRDG